MTPDEAKNRFLNIGSCFGRVFVFVMPFAVCCDETGTDNPSDWVGVVGYLASLEQFAELSRQRQIELNSASLPFFHFS